MYGERRGKIYDDLQGIQEILSFPDHAFHRNVDKFVLRAGEEHRNVLKTAIIAPTTVYGRWTDKNTQCFESVPYLTLTPGRGRGPCSQRSRQVHEMSKFTLQLQKIPIIGRGLSIGGNIHIADVTGLFMLLFDRAAHGNKDDKIWGGEAYYLAENGEHCWGDIAKLVGKIAVEEGFIPSAEVQALDVESARRLAGFEAVSWGLNMRCRARRAREYLGWEPSAPFLEDEVPGIVKGEWQRLL